MIRKRCFFSISFIVCLIFMVGKQIEVTALENQDQLIESKQTVSTKKEFGSLSNLREFSLDSQETGIIAYNFGKSMEDIKALNSDEQAAKEMILYESGATGHGLFGDVTDKIQVGNLGDLFSTSSNDLAEHHVTLTVPAEYSGTGKELSTNVIIYTGKVSKVSTWSQLDSALRANDTTIIDVQSNITNTSKGRVDVLLSSNKKDYVLLGNGYSIDFIGYSYRWPESASNTRKPIVDNIDLYGGNYYGPVTMWNLAGPNSSVTYRNVNYTGSQVTASFQAKIIFEGKNNIRSKDTYYNSYDGAQRTMADTKQAGIESHTLLFEKNTDTLIEVEQGDGVVVGGYYSNIAPVSNIQPSLTMLEGSKVVVRTLGNDGEQTNWNGGDYPAPSTLSLRNNAKIDIGNKANLLVETGEGTTRVPVKLGYVSSVSKWITSINLGVDSQFTVNVGGPIPNNNKKAAFMLRDNSQINIGQNASLNVNARNMTTGAPVISMGTSSLIDVEKSGNLTINKTGGMGSILDLSADSIFNVSDEGSAGFVSNNEETTTSPMINGGNKSNFIIDERGIFTSQIKNGTGERTMLKFDKGANFKFANARRIDLDARGNPNAFLISMDTGTFLADIQAVEAWTKKDADKETPTYSWSPMYGIQISYSGTNTSKVVGNSLTYKTREDFIQNYNTKDMSRVLFTYIPDVHIELDEVSDNPNLSSGKVFKGFVNNRSSVAFYKVVDEKDSSKDVLLSNANIASPVEGESKKYHVVANDAGTYEFSIPSDTKLVAGDKIKAYGFLNAKDDYVINTVQDKTPPTAQAETYYISVNSKSPSPDKLVKNVSDTNPNNKNFTYKYNESTSKETIDKYMTEIGDHKVKVDVSDEAGNTTTVDTLLSVAESSTHVSGDELSISFKDLRNMSEKQMKEYILSKGNISAYKLLNGKKIELNQFVSVKDLGGLADIDHIQSTPYTISLVVSTKDAGDGVTEDITGTMTVKVTDIDAVLTVSFINEAGKVLDDYTTTVKALVGDTIDLTKDKNIKEKQTLLESNGYLLGAGPEQETAFKVNNTEMTIVYHVEGTVMIKSVPTVLDFGKLTYTASPNRIEKPTYDKPLIVSDTRADTTGGWSMYAQISSPLQTPDGKTLEDVIHYVSGGKDKVLSENSQAIFSYKENKAGTYDISDNWGDKPKSDGIKLEIGSSGDIYTGQYTGEITWKIMEGQP